MAANPLPPPQSFSMHLNTSTGVAVLKCSGRLTNESSERFRAEVKSLLPHNRLLYLDLSDLHYLDSSGLGAVLATYVSAKSAGCEVKLVDPSEPVRNLLKMTHLASVLESYGG